MAEDKSGQKSFSRPRKNLRGVGHGRSFGHSPRCQEATIAFDNCPTRCNLFVHLIIRNRGPDETYLSTQRSATQEKAWLSLPDAYPFWTRHPEASTCQRPAAYLRIAAGRTLLFVVEPLSGGLSAREGVVVAAGWSLSLHRVLRALHGSA